MSWPRAAAMKFTLSAIVVPRGLAARSAPDHAAAVAAVSISAEIAPPWTMSPTVVGVCYCVSVAACVQQRDVVRARVVGQETRLTSEEVRFLRTGLGWSGKTFARHMGVAEETVSRWETGAAHIGAQADRLLRLLVVHDQRPLEYPMSHLADIHPRRSTALRVELEPRDEQWERISA